MSGRRMDLALDPGYRFNAQQLYVSGRLYCVGEIVTLSVSLVGTSRGLLAVRLPTLLTSTTTLGLTAQEFTVTAGASYDIYRLNIVTAEPTNPDVANI